MLRSEPHRTFEVAPARCAREVTCAVMCAFALIAACSNSEVPSTGRGTEACRIWQDSVCDWAERCGALTRQACDEEYQAVTCRSDEIASQCADTFERSSCTVPDNCTLADIADPAPAAQACDTLMNRFCERVVQCGTWSTQQDCLTSARADVDCSRSVAYTLDYDSCLESIDQMRCDSGGLPPVCARVIISRM